MTLPASGTISMLQVRTELGATGAISLGQTSVRNLAGVASGAISLNVLHGKANAFNGTISSHQANLNLRTWALANGWNGSTAATITINSGIYIYSTSTGNAGLVIDGSWPNGLTLINNGYIIGMGGKGGSSVTWATYSAPEAGGNAISLGVSCTITNNSYIAGGGGGGGYSNRVNSGGGASGGGGGGAGGGAGGSSVANNVAEMGTATGGAGGGIGASGSNGVATPSSSSGSGGGGGRILPGVGGAGTQRYGLGGGAGASGGIGIAYLSSGSPAAASGAGGGGGWGASGGSGGYNPTGPNGVGGSGGGAGANPVGIATIQSTGAAGGKAVALNGFSVTWNATGTRYGTIA